MWYNETMKCKRVFISIILAVLLLSCAGCDLSDRDSLFALPELSGQYSYLQKELDKILAEGATYTVAGTGSLRSSVQMVDLNGDGKEEALGLFLSAEGVPEVHVFRMEERGCTWLGKLTGVGSGVREIRLLSRGTQGQKALAVSWAYEKDTRYYGMTVAALGGNELFVMLDLQYTAFLSQDLDEDGVEELTFVRPSRSDESLYSCVYQVSGDSYRLAAQASLCIEAQFVMKMHYDQVQEGKTALVVESSAKQGGYVTDVLDFNGEALENLTRDVISGSGLAFWRQAAVGAYDVDGDGLLEVPASITPDVSGDAESNILWMNLDATSVTEYTMTYHNISEKWALCWPEAWPHELLVGMYADYSNKENVATTTFYVWDADVENDTLRKQVLLTVWAFHGEDRVRLRNQHNTVTALNETGEILYGYTLPEKVSDKYFLSDEIVKSLFRLFDGALEGGGE